MANGNGIPGLTEDALATRISGGKPLPQAATQTIARRLLGPALADRYGDVLGIRNTGLQDIARDFAVGAISGDPARADQLKMQVLQNYRSELRREEDQAAQREEAARQTMQGFFTMLQQGRSVPRELRKDFFKEGMSKLGIEATSPLFMNLLSNYEKFGDAYDSLADPELQRLADEDPLAAVQQLTAMGTDGAQALEVVKSVQQMRRYREETQHIIAQSKRLGAITQGDPNAKARAAFVTRMSTQFRDLRGRPRPPKPEELDQIVATADRLYPPTGGKELAPVGIPQGSEGGAPPVPKAVPGALPVPGGATSTTSTTTSTTPAQAGIAREEKAVPSSSEGQQKVRRLTGTVSRVE